MNRPILRTSHRNPLPGLAPVAPPAEYAARVDRMLHGLEELEAQARAVGRRYGTDGAEIVEAAFASFCKFLLNRRTQVRLRERAYRARCAAISDVHRVYSVQQTA